MKHILEAMKDVPEEKRGARFSCAVAVAVPDGRIFHCRGICEGCIAREMRGEHGFGYDPIFYLPSLGLTTAELPPATKYALSHRGRAARRLLRNLTRIRPTAAGGHPIGEAE